MSNLDSRCPFGTVYNGVNCITWTCGGPPVVTFDIVYIHFTYVFLESLSLTHLQPCKSEQKIYHPTLLFADKDNSYSCYETISLQTINLPLGTVYIIQLVIGHFSSLNLTYVCPALHTHLLVFTSISIR